MKRRLSTALTAITAFLFLNLALSFFTPIKFNPFNYPYQGWGWWSFHDLRSSQEIHNVALLGSSLMVAAVNNCDANYLNRPLNLTEHHRSFYLDDKLEATFKGKFRSYNLAGPGQMPSDAYLTLKGMLSTAHRPDVVIYGVAPRDFIDSQLSSPTDTEPFHFLSRLVSTDDCAGGLFRDPLGRLSWFINRNLYFAHHAIDWQMLLERKTNRLLSVLAPLPYGSKPYTFWQRTALLPKYKAGEIHPNAVITHPLSKEVAKANFKDNTDEYRERYKRADRHTYSTQLYFLGKLANLCKKERIELILVNMPIARENINVLGAPTYLDYVTTLKERAYALNIAFYDLNFFYLYNTDLYHDYVHLNAFGGAKFLDSLVSVLNSDPRSQLAMQMAGRELWKQEQMNKLATPVNDATNSIHRLKEKLIEHNLIQTSSGHGAISKLREIVKQEGARLRRQIGARLNKSKSNSEQDLDDEPGLAM